MKRKTEREREREKALKEICRRLTGGSDAFVKCFCERLLFQGLRAMIKNKRTSKKMNIFRQINSIEKQRACNKLNAVRSRRSRLENPIDR